MLTEVPAFGLRLWTYLPRSPGITGRLANPHGPIDSYASWIGQPFSCRKAINPDRYRSGSDASVIALKEVGPTKNSVGPTSSMVLIDATSGRGTALIGWLEFSGTGSRF